MRSGPWLRCGIGIGIGFGPGRADVAPSRRTTRLLTAANEEVGHDHYAP